MHRLFCNSVPWQLPSSFSPPSSFSTALSSLISSLLFPHVEVEKQMKKVRINTICNAI